MIRLSLQPGIDLAVKTERSLVAHFTFLCFFFFYFFFFFFFLFFFFCFWMLNVQFPDGLSQHGGCDKVWFHSGMGNNPLDLLCTSVSFPDDYFVIVTTIVYGMAASSICLNGSLKHCNYNVSLEGRLSVYWRVLRLSVQHYLNLNGSKLTWLIFQSSWLSCDMWAVTSSTKFMFQIYDCCHSRTFILQSSRSEFCTFTEGSGHRFDH